MIEIDDTMFKQVVDEISSTERGRLFLAYLKEYLGWDEAYMSLDGDSYANVYYGTRRSVYGWLRGFVRPEDLKQIEFNYKRKAVTNGRSSITSRHAARSTGKQ